ncbi:MAG: hypothetical protein KBD37_04255 [Burkholderiales bacterium]|nr:hypothetical protein [Burkholderiales bacterium]
MNEFNLLNTLKAEKLKYHNSNLRLERNSIGEIKSKDNLFSVGVYAFFSWVGQAVFALLGFNSISEDNLKVALKSFLATVCADSKPRFKSDDLVNAQLDLTKLVNSDGTQLNFKELTQLLIELQGIQYAFKDYLSSDKGRKCKDMLDKIICEIRWKGIKEPLSKLKTSNITLEDLVQDELNQFKQNLCDTNADAEVKEKDVVMFMALSDPCNYLPCYTQQSITNMMKIGNKLSNHINGLEELTPRWRKLKEDFDKASGILNKFFPDQLEDGSWMIRIPQVHPGIG